MAMHVAQKGASAGQLVECPAQIQCTLKDENGNRAPHYENRQDYENKLAQEMDPFATVGGPTGPVSAAAYKAAEKIAIAEGATRKAAHQAREATRHAAGRALVGIGDGIIAVDAAGKRAVQRVSAVYSHVDSSARAGIIRARKTAQKIGRKTTNAALFAAGVPGAVRHMAKRKASNVIRKVQNGYQAVVGAAKAGYANGQQAYEMRQMHQARPDRAQRSAASRPMKARVSPKEALRKVTAPIMTRATQARDSLRTSRNNARNRLVQLRSGAHAKAAAARTAVVTSGRHAIDKAKAPGVAAMSRIRRIRDDRVIQTKFASFLADQREKRRVSRNAVINARQQWLENRWSQLEAKKIPAPAMA